MFLIWCTCGITGSTHRGCGIYDNLESLGKIIRSSGTSVSNFETKAELNDSEQQAGVDSTTIVRRMNERRDVTVHTQA